MSAKRKQNLKDRQQRRKALQERASSALQLSRGELDIYAEIDHIVACAQAGDQRCVIIGTLLLFSTHGGDAWLLEPKDNLALQLAHEGAVQPVPVVDGPKQFSIHWKKSFEFRGSVFATRDHETGQQTFIEGYPIAAILDVIAQFERASREWK